MPPAEIEDVVLGFFRSRGSVPGQTRAEQLACDYLEEKLIDSFGVVEMILELEEKLDIHFEADHFQAPEFRTIGGLIALSRRLVERRLSDART